MRVSNRFNSEIRNEDIRQGWVNISYDSETFDYCGLWLTAQCGSLNELQVSAAWHDPVVQILKPDSELLATAALCALGIMPPEIFADWLQDRTDTYLPQCGRFEDSTDASIRLAWDGILWHLRRFAAQPLSP